MKTLKSYKNLFTALTLSCTIAYAQTPADGWKIENIHGPSQVGIVDSIPVDVNQDGMMDVVSASIEDGHLRAYINQGNLEFEQQYISTEVPGVFRVSATDLNNDERIDFLIPSIETNEIIALIADPNSQPYGYRKQIIAENVLLPTDAQAGDFNGDGLMDVVSTSFEENLLLLHGQNNQGGFSKTILSDVVMNPRKLVIEDFDNDQQLDILLASSEDNSVRLYNNNGDTSFAEILISDQLAGIRYINRCDQPGADFPNFVAGVTGANTVLLFSNIENNRFTQTIIDDDLPEADVVHCANIDLDQELEIVSTSRFEGTIYSLETSGPINKQLIANMRDGYITVNVSDFIGDKTPLILTQAFFENRNLFYTPNQVNQETVVWEDFPDGVTKVTQADINQDGVLDFVASSFIDDRVQWYDGTNNRHHIIAENIDGAADIVAIDFNQDGLTDIVSAASFDNRFYWHVNMGGGEFETKVLSDMASFANSVETGDINGDGNLDVIGTSATDDALRWFEFTNDSIQTVLIDDNNDAPNDVVAGDVDGDGDVDLVVANFFSNDVIYYSNLGSGLFKSEKIIQNRDRPFAVLLYPSQEPDLLNIIVTVSGDNQVWLFEQQQGNQFNEILLTTEITNPRKMSYDPLLNQLLITSPNDETVLRIEGFFDGSPLAPLVNNYVGVSDINLGHTSGEYLSGSIDMNSIIMFNKKGDLIFKNGFGDSVD